MEDREFYTVQDIQNILRIGRNQAYKVIKAMPYMRIGKSIRVSKIAFDEWVRKNLDKDIII